jgi:hypothetical protein
VTQRSEWRPARFSRGLDVLANDALELLGGYFDPPPVVCYFHRGLGAAARLRGRGSLAAARARHDRACSERANGGPRNRPLARTRGRPPGRGLRDLVPPRSGSRSTVPAAAACGVAAVGSLSLGNRRPLLVNPKLGIGDARPDRRRELAGAVRSPSQRRRTASRAVDPHPGRLRDREGSLSTPAVGASSRTYGVPLTHL